MQDQRRNVNPPARFAQVGDKQYLGQCSDIGVGRGVQADRLQDVRVIDPQFPPGQRRRMEPMQVLGKSISSGGKANAVPDNSSRMRSGGTSLD